MFFAAKGLQQDWAMKRQLLSPAYFGIEGILQHYLEPGFYEEVQLFFHDRLLLDICWYLLRSYEPLGLDHGELPVMQFCRMVTSDSLNCPRLDS